MSVAQVAGEDGSRFAGHDLQQWAAVVAGKLDQDVDLIFADLGGGLLVVQTGDVAPAARRIFACAGDGVRIRRIRVTSDLKLLMIVIRQQRFDEKHHRVVAEISRKISDAQSAIRIEIIRVWRELKPKVVPRAAEPRLDAHQIVAATSTQAHAA